MGQQTQQAIKPLQRHEDAKPQRQLNVGDPKQSIDKYVK
jgi:hypothetical protein